MPILNSKCVSFSFQQSSNQSSSIRASRLEHVGFTFDAWARAMAAGLFSSAWYINDCTGNHWPSAHRLGVTTKERHTDLILKSLHGLGDAVQMLRYVPQLKTLAARTYVYVPEALRPLLGYFRGVDHRMLQDPTLTSIHCQAPLPEIEMSELPFLFRTRFTDLPLATSYLALPEHVLNENLSCMGRTTKPRVGLVWAGGEWDCERWIPMHSLESLVENQRFDWWNLQGGPQAEDGRYLPLKNHQRICGTGLLPLTATIANCDLLITIDTLAVHLAGALGKPAWLLLKHDADWRWMEGRTDSPWYPSLRLFRQTSQGDWTSVIASVAQALNNYA